MTSTATGVALIEAAVIATAVILLLISGLTSWRLIRRRMMTARMIEVLQAEGSSARLPRQRRRAPLPIRDSADVRFTFVLRDVERAPGDWRSWFRLSQAYADAGDRGRARKSMRQAVRLFAESEVQSPRGGPGPTDAGTSA